MNSLDVTRKDLDSEQQSCIYNQENMSVLIGVSREEMNMCKKSTSRNSVL